MVSHVCPMDSIPLCTARCKQNKHDKQSKPFCLDNYSGLHPLSLDQTTLLLVLDHDGPPPALYASSEVVLSALTPKYPYSNSQPSSAVSQIFIRSKTAVARLETILAIGNWYTVHWCFSILHGKGIINLVKYVDTSWTSLTGGNIR